MERNIGITSPSKVYKKLKNNPKYQDVVNKLELEVKALTIIFKTVKEGYEKAKKKNPGHIGLPGEGTFFETGTIRESYKLLDDVKNALIKKLSKKKGSLFKNVAYGRDDVARFLNIAADILIYKEEGTHYLIGRDKDGKFKGFTLADSAGVIQSNTVYKDRKMNAFTAIKHDAPHEKVADYILWYLE